MDKFLDTYGIAQDTKLLLLLCNSQLEHSVESNHIGTIDGKFFKRNPKLEMVYLVDNELEEVSPVLFKHNSNLEFLHLDKNKVILINDIISSSR